MNYHKSAIWIFLLYLHLRSHIFSRIYEIPFLFFSSAFRIIGVEGLEGEQAASYSLYDSLFPANSAIMNTADMCIHAAHSNFSADDYYEVVPNISRVRPAERVRSRVGLPHASHDKRSFAFPVADNADSSSKRDRSLSLFPFLVFLFFHRLQIRMSI